MAPSPTTSDMDDITLEFVEVGMIQVRELALGLPGTGTVLLELAGSGGQATLTIAGIEPEQASGFLNTVGSLLSNLRIDVVLDS